MKPTLAIYRRRVVAFFALVLTLLGIGGAYVLMRLSLEQGEEHLGRQASLLSRELGTLFEVQEMLLAGLAGRDPLEIEMVREFLPEQLGFLGVCSFKERGKILSVFTGPRLEGLAVPPNLLDTRWHMTPYLAEDGTILLTFALPYGEDWLLGGFLPEKVFAALDPLLEPQYWSLLADVQGRIFMSWNGDGILLPGGIAPRSFLRSEALVADRYTPRDVYVLSRAIPHGLALVSGVWKDRAVLQAARRGMMVAGGGVVLVLLLFLPIHFGFLRISRDFQKISSVVRQLGWDIHHIPDPLQAIDTFRRQWEEDRLEDRVEFQNAVDVVRGFQELLDAVASQGQEVAALYQETTAMQMEVEQSNDELRGALEHLEELGTFAQTAAEARSTKEAAMALVRSLITFSGARAGAVALGMCAGMTLIAYEGEGTLRKGCAEALKGLGHAPQKNTLLRGTDGVAWRTFPISYLGETLGVLCLAETGTENRVAKRVEGVMSLFIPHMGGIVRSHILVDEVRRSYHYLALRLQGVSSTYHEETGDHLRRIRDYALFLGRRAGLDDDTLEDLGTYSMLHDIGKLKVPREILAKPGALNAQEFEEVMRHTSYGVDLLGNSEWLGMARDICLYHHERWDGSGYPEGRTGEAIPLVARIVGLADVYDALRSPRCYKPAYGHEKVCDIILRGDGRLLPQHFDPALLKLFSEEHRTFEAIFASHCPDESDALRM